MRGHIDPKSGPVSVYLQPFRRLRPGSAQRVAPITVSPPSRVGSVMQPRIGHPPSPTRTASPGGSYPFSDVPVSHPPGKTSVKSSNYSWRSKQSTRIPPLPSRSPVVATAGPKAVRVTSLLNSLGPIATPKREPLPRLEYTSARYYAESVDYSLARSTVSLTQSSALARTSTNLTNMGSTSTSSSQISARMVGRGGSGSMPRSIASVPSISNIKSTSTAQLSLAPSGSISPQDLKNPKMRFVGRGGSGSKQRKVKEQPKHNPRPSVSSTSMSVAYGRGGVASRLRVVSEGAVEAPSVVSSAGGLSLKLPWKRSKKPQKPKKGSEQLPTDQRSHQRVRSNVSIASADTVRSKPHQLPKSASADALTISSMDDDAISPVRRPKPSGGSLSKLARTMGELPPHLIYENLRSHRHPPLPVIDTRIRIDSISSESSSLSVPPTHPTNPSLSAKTSTSTIQSSTNANSLDPISRWRMSVATAASTLTTSSCELHRFNLADDLSESWGEVQGGWEPDTDVDHIENLGRGDDFDPPSPITFRPPTPADPKKKKLTVRESWLSVTSVAGSALEESEDDSESQAELEMQRKYVAAAYAIFEAPETDVSSADAESIATGTRDAVKASEPANNAVVGAAELRPPVDVDDSNSTSSASDYYPYVPSTASSDVDEIVASRGGALQAGLQIVLNRPSSASDEGVEDGAEALTPMAEKAFSHFEMFRAGERAVSSDSSPTTASPFSATSPASTIPTSAGSSPTTSLDPPVLYRGPFSGFHSAGGDDFLSSLTTPSISSPSILSSPVHRHKPSLASITTASSSELCVTRPDTPMRTVPSLKSLTSKLKRSSSTAGSASTTSSFASLSNTGSDSRRTARRLSISADDWNEGVIVLVGSPRKVTFNDDDVAEGGDLEEFDSEEGAQEPPSTPNWSGQWNTEMPDVIRALRLL
ncbi:hypothetical protein DFP72DRAFT_1082920 [Ephemerocybe angulata]|uniref:Uncharacterized protein n=1 Tax=Ephemerocybe angulata TaxID=980116 RepID=A0A8H6LV48_9AGAR|nr:hypothetical protein DFP72DRAFT_1082920 [Tulosesus angulatus]